MIKIKLGCLIMNYKKKRAFTLMGLLVVISIIALLMSVLMPSLRMARKQAKAVVCQSNLKQWGLMFGMYVNDNDGRFNTGYSSPDPDNKLRAQVWTHLFRDQYGEPGGLTCCPEATKPQLDYGPYLDQQQGFLRGPGHAKEPFAAWGINGYLGTPDDPEDFYYWREGIWGSYGINGWINNPPSHGPTAQYYYIGSGSNDSSGSREHWRTTSVRGAERIPLFLDCMWMHLWPNESDIAPEYDGELNPVQQMMYFTLNRHSGYTNGVFVDFSVRKIGLKELWKFKWSRSWTGNGGPREGLPYPAGWPDWMKNFKTFE